MRKVTITENELIEIITRVISEKKKSKKKKKKKNTTLCARGKNAAKAKYDVYPSAYANAYMVKEYKKMGGKYKGKKKATGGAIRLNQGGSVMVQGRGCGAMMNDRRKKTKMPRS